MLKHKRIHQLPSLKGFPQAHVFFSQGVRPTLIIRIVRLYKTFTVS